MNDNLLTLIGVPLDLGSKSLGVDMGPQALRYSNVIRKLEHAGLDIKDNGNIECANRANLTSDNPRMHYLDEVVRVNREIARQSEEAVRGGRKPVVLGGDHSIDLGAVSGASTALDFNLGLIYLDAHGDMNTEQTTQTGNIHGMHLASLIGLGAPELKNLHNDSIKIATENLLHIGGSDFDPAELDLIKDRNLSAFTLHDLLCDNLGPLLELIDSLAAKTPNVWVSLDLDVIDQIYAPGAGMPNAKGLTYREIATIAERIGSKCNVIGLDVVEYNPLQDENYRTAELAIELIAKFLGKNYSWYTDYMERNSLS
ncbi:MAG: arginase [Candidatus Saccharimonadales bacterium]